MASACKGIEQVLWQLLQALTSNASSSSGVGTWVTNFSLLGNNSCLYILLISTATASATTFSCCSGSGLYEHPGASTSTALMGPALYGHRSANCLLLKQQASTVPLASSALQVLC